MLCRDKKINVRGKGVTGVINPASIIHPDLVGVRARTGLSQTVFCRQVVDIWFSISIYFWLIIFQSYIYWLHVYV